MGMSVTPPSGRLIIVCGLPGSGKTTHARLLETKLRAIRLNADEWMHALSCDLWDEDMRGKIEALQWKLGVQLLASGQTVILEWETWGRSERDTLRLAARDIGAAVELHYLSAAVDVLFERIQKRGIENPATKLEDLLRWAKVFQSPTVAEMALFDAPGEVDADRLARL